MRAPSTVGSARTDALTTTHKNKQTNENQQQGRTTILDAPRTVVALHRARHAFPVSLLVTKTRGNGADASFTATFKAAAPPPPGAMTAWLLPQAGGGGKVLAVDQAFSELLGAVAVVDACCDVRVLCAELGHTRADAHTSLPLLHHTRTPTGWGPTEIAGTSFADLAADPVKLER